MSIDRLVDAIVAMEQSTEALIGALAAGDHRRVMAAVTELESAHGKLVSVGVQVRADVDAGRLDPARLAELAERHEKLRARSRTAHYLLEQARQTDAALLRIFASLGAYQPARVEGVRL
jgi:hypothetical protein